MSTQPDIPEWAKRAAEHYANIVAPLGSDAGDWERITKTLGPIIARHAPPTQPTGEAVWREARDTVLASVAEDGISDQRRAYRRNLVRRLNAALGLPIEQDIP